MDLSVVAVLSKPERGFTKAMVRNRAFFDKVRATGNMVLGSEPLFDVLQIVFLSRDESYVHAAGIKQGSRIYQVEVGIPDGLDYRPGNDNHYLRRMNDQIQKAIQVAPIGDTQKESLLQQIEQLVPNGNA